MSPKMRGRASQDALSDKVLARRAVARIAAIAFLVAAGAIHAAQIRVHLNEWSVAGLFFIASAVAQMGLAIALTRGVAWRARDVRGLVRSCSSPPSRNLITGVVATSLILIVMWGISRAAGVPFGPSAGIPEPVNRPDSLATMFELLTLAAILPLLSRSSTLRTSWVPRRAHTVTVAALLLSTFATTAVALQPVTCDRAPRAERSTEEGKPNQAAIDALLSHANAGKHPAEQRDKQEQSAAHATSGRPTVDPCH